MNSGKQMHCPVGTWLIVSALAFLTACAGTIQPAETIGPNDPVAMSAIRQVYVKLAEQKSWRVKSTHVTEKKTTATTISFAQPDRLHMVADEFEQIHVSGNAYMKTADGKWQKLPLNFGNMIEQYRKDPSLVESTVSGATVVGKDVVEGKSMTVYRYYSSAKIAGGLASGGAWSKMWVDSAGLPRKIESEGKGQVLGFTNTSTTTSVYYDFGANIRINAPI